MSDQKPLPTLWEIPDQLWQILEPVILRRFPPNKMGRGRSELRRVLNGIIYVMRTGCQWQALPEKFGKKSTVHDWHQTFSKSHLYDELWAEIVTHCGREGAVDLEWQSVDTSFAKAPLGQGSVGPNPTDRAKLGSKRSILVDSEGYPLSVEVAAANVNDHLLLETTLKGAIVVEDKKSDQEQHLCLDKAYDNALSEEVTLEQGFEPHIRRRGVDDKGLREEGKKPRRWVVERCFSWFNRFRKILIRWAKKDENYEGFMELASVLMWYRRYWQATAKA